jgi:hypothetical protein
MANGLEEDLRELIARRSILVIVGSGVSIGATRNSTASSWPGLLKLGAAYCRKLNPALDDAWEKRLLGEIASGAVRTPRPPTLSPAIIEYLHRLEVATAKLQLIGLGQGVQIELPIQQAYITDAVAASALPGLHQTPKQD